MGWVDAAEAARTCATMRSKESDLALASAGYCVQPATFDGGHVEPPTELELATILEALGR